MVPPVVTSTVERAAGTPVGLALKSSEKVGTLLVDEIDPKGPFFGSALRVNMEVKSVNNVDCANLTVVQATKLLEKELFVTVLAVQAAPLEEGSMITVTLVKSSAESKVGLKLRDIDECDGLYISEICDGSLASMSKLRPGMLVAKINNVDVTRMSSSDAAKLMTEATGTLTFLAYTPYSGAGPANVGFSKYVTATADVDLVSEKEGADSKDSADDKTDTDSLKDSDTKKETDVKVGLELTQDECGKVVIKGVDPKGPFCDTPLRASMELLQVNGRKCNSCEHAIELMKEGSKPATLLAFKSDNRFAPGTLISAVLTKETRDTKLGLRFGMGRNTPVVSNIKDGSPAALTDLDAGMIIHSINNNLCAFMSPPEVSQTLVEAEGTVTILAEVPHPETGAPVTDAVSYVTASMQKNKTEGKVGLKLGGRDSGIIITEIADGSLAASTDLRVGMEVLSINNVGLTNEKVTVAASLLAGSQGHLTVVAKRPSLPAGALVTGALKRESVTVKWGVKLGFRGDNFVINGIYADSPAAATDLEIGMLVRSINNVDARTMKASDISKIFSAETLIMTIVAETTRETNMMCPSHIMAVRSIRGLVRIPEPEEPEPVEEDAPEDPADDDASKRSDGDSELLDPETEIQRLRAMNAALMAKLAKERDAPPKVIKTPSKTLVGKMNKTDPIGSESDSSSDEDSLPASYPEEKLKGAKDMTKWLTTKGINFGEVTNVIEC